MADIDDACKRYLKLLYLQRYRGKRGPYPNQAAMRGSLGVLIGTTLITGAQQIIEIGVNTGQSTAAFLYALAWFTGGKLWSCDIEPPRPPIDELIDLPIWEFDLGHSAILAESAPGQCDILLIDGAFSQRGSDLFQYGPKVRPGGFILVHDIERPEIEAATKAYADLRHLTLLDDAGKPPKLGVIHVPHD